LFELAKFYRVYDKNTLAYFYCDTLLEFSKKTTFNFSQYRDAIQIRWKTLQLYGYTYSQGYEYCENRSIFWPSYL